MVSVLLFKLTFFKKMLFNLLNFDYLLTFPASCKHWTITPIMHVETFIIPIWIMSTAKVTYLIKWYFITKLFEILLLLVIFLIVFFLLNLTFIFLDCSLGFANISINNNLGFVLFFRLFNWSSLRLIDFLEFCHQRIQLCLSQAIIVSTHFVSTHLFIKFPHTIISWISNIGLSMLNTFDGIFYCFNLLIISQIV